MATFGARLFNEDIRTFLFWWYTVKHDILEPQKKKWGNIFYTQLYLANTPSHFPPGIPSKKFWVNASVLI